MRLKDKTIIVTGAASGIGKACALAWMEVGANIVLTDINGSAVNELSEALGEKHRRTPSIPHLRLIGSA